MIFLVPTIVRRALMSSIRRCFRISSASAQHSTISCTSHLFEPSVLTKFSDDISATESLTSVQSSSIPNLFIEITDAGDCEIFNDDSSSSSSSSCLSSPTSRREANSENEQEQEESYTATMEQRRKILLRKVI